MPTMTDRDRVESELNKWAAEICETWDDYCGSLDPDTGAPEGATVEERARSWRLRDKLDRLTGDYQRGLVRPAARPRHRADPSGGIGEHAVGCPGCIAEGLQRAADEGGG